MRVSGGIGRGQRLKVPKGLRVRPTSDKVKQALFNILGNSVIDGAFLDLFAGAGGIGIEALCRGAGRVVLVDSSRESIAVIKKNIQLLKIQEGVEVLLSKAEMFLKKISDPFDIVFLDPPYAQEMQPLLEMIARSGALKPGGIVIAEHFKKQPSPERAGSLMLYREARYGDTVLAFYKNRSQETEDRS
jgi:16S rRNA (guanine966-N2)-methyltransferase